MSLPRVTVSEPQVTVIEPPVTECASSNCSLLHKPRAKIPKVSVEGFFTFTRMFALLSARSFVCVCVMYTHGTLRSL